MLKHMNNECIVPPLLSRPAYALILGDLDVRHVPGVYTSVCVCKDSALFTRYAIAYTE